MSNLNFFSQLFPFKEKKEAFKDDWDKDSGFFCVSIEIFNTLILYRKKSFNPSTKWGFHSESLSHFA